MIVEQDCPVVGLQPVLEVQPSGRDEVVNTTEVETQDCPVVELQPVLEVQPAGNGAQDSPVVML